MGHWRLERRDRIAVATFSAPPRNFMTFADMTELEGLVEEVGQDEAITVLVLASDVAGWFVAHGDLEDLLKLGRGEEFDGDALSWPRTLARFGSMPQIVVGGNQRTGGGGGLEMTARLHAAGGRSPSPPDLRRGRDRSDTGRRRHPALAEAHRSRSGCGANTLRPRDRRRGGACDWASQNASCPMSRSLTACCAGSRPSQRGHPRRWLRPSGRSSTDSRYRSRKDWPWRLRGSRPCLPTRPR